MASSFVISAVFSAVDKMSKVVDGISKKVKGMSDVAGKVGNVAGKIGKGIKSVAGFAVDAGEAVFGFVNDMANAGDEVAKTARQLGISAKALQEFRYIAERSGLSVEQMDGALGRMNMVLGNYTNKTKETLGMVGLTIQEVRKAGPEEAFFMIAKGLEKVQNPLDRARIATDLFGRNAGNILNALGEGEKGMRALAEEAHRVGYVMSDEMLATSEAFNDQVLDMKSAFGSLARSLGSALMPILLDIIKKVTEFFIANRETFDRVGKAIGKVFEFIGPLLDRAIPLLMAFVEKFAVAFEKAFVALGPALETTFNFLEEMLAPLSEIVMVLMDLLVPIFEALNPVLKVVFMFLKPIIWALSWIVKILAFVLKPVIQLIGALFQNLFDIFSFVVNGIKEQWDNMTKEIVLKWLVFQIIFKAVVKAVQKLWQSLTTIFKRVWATILRTFKGPIEAIKAGFKAIGDFLGGVWQGILDTAGFLWEGLKTGFDNAIKFVQAIFFTFADALLGFWGNIVKAILGAAKNVGEFLGQDMSMLEGMINTMSKMQADIHSKSLFADKSGGIKNGPISAETNKIVAGLEAKSKTQIDVKVTSDAGSRATVEGVKSSGPVKPGVSTSSRTGASVPPFPH